MATFDGMRLDRGVFVVLMVISVQLISLVLTHSDLFEGSPCQLKDGTWGVCEDINTCQWIRDNLPTRRISYTDIVQCSFKGSVSIVCCKDEKPTSTDIPTRGFVFGGSSPASPAPGSQKPANRNNPQRKSEIECAKHNSPALSYHILNGEKADEGEFPFMAALGYENEQGPGYKWQCGGTLINSRYILTAAHCCARAQPLVALVGDVLIGTSSGLDTAQEIPIASITFHPEYRGNANYHDLALLELERDVINNNNVRPGCLWTDTNDLKPDSRLIVIGWGRISAYTDETSEQLLKTNLTAIPLDQCNTTYKEANYFTRRLSTGFNSGQMCAHDSTKKSDACQGDSGGPLIYEDQSKGLDYVVGVTSFGASCGTAIPGVYARIAHYLSWIEEVAWPS